MTQINGMASLGTEQESQPVKLPVRQRGPGMPFVKGESGNPKGRPRQLVELRDAARTHTAEAINTLVKWMRSDDPRASVPAANSLLDRAWGKPVQPIDGDGEGGDIGLGITVIERVIVRPLTDSDG